MKIGDVKVGIEYGLRQKYGDPRQVKVLAIEKTNARQWDNALEKWADRQVRRVKVKYLDAPEGYRSFTTPDKGTVALVDAKNLAAPWSEIGPNVRKRKEQERRQAEASASYEKRMKALLGRNFSGNVSTSLAGEAVSLSVYGSRQVEKLIALAEKGKEVSK